MKLAAPKRKLTTIMVADVAGYSRLMARDEEGTYARLAALNRDLVDSATAAHGATLIKKTGDGFLAEFASVVEAMRCAIGIQQGVSERNADLRPDQHIAFRIGINLGDVIVEADDIYGDGVNVAARLEGLAEPGGIVVSRAVRDHVRDKLQLDFEDLGEQQVKNIARPIRVFRVRSKGHANPASPTVRRPRVRRAALACVAVLAAAMALAGGWWWTTHPRSPVASITASSTSPSASGSAGATQKLAPRLSIVVLPFANLGDPRQDYFAEGVTDSLITDLSRALPGSFVVARGTAFTYKSQKTDAAQVGRDLNVRYVLVGSILSDMDWVRVNAQLIDAQSNASLWAERFDKKRTDVLMVQDQIVGRLARSVGLQVIALDRGASSSDPAATDFVMRGQVMANRPASPETMMAARAMFQRALEHDPDNVDALAGVATTYVFEGLNRYYSDGRDVLLREAEALIRRALAIEPRHMVALKANAERLRAEGKFKDAIAASQAVIAQNPGDPWAYKEVGFSELYLGRLQEALNWFEKADQLGPRDPSRWIWLGAMGRVYLLLGRDADAIRMLQLAADANPRDCLAYAILTVAYALSGRAEDAKAALAECLRLQPDMTIKRLFESWSVPIQTASQTYLRQHERLRDGLRMAGMREE